jgi:hypothetical protein
MRHEAEEEAVTKEGLLSKFTSLVAYVEEKVVALSDVVQRSAAKFKGRAKGPRFVTKPLLGKLVKPGNALSGRGSAARNLSMKLTALAAGLQKQSCVVPQLWSDVRASDCSELSCGETISRLLLQEQPQSEIRKIRDQLNEEAKTEVAQSVKAKIQSRNTFFEKLMENGAKGAHRYSKGPVFNSTCHVAMQEEAHAYAAEYKKHWKGFDSATAADAEREEYVWPSNVTDELESIEVHTFRSLMNSFRSEMGVGSDRFNPKSLTLLDDADLGLVIQFLRECEKVGSFPAVCSPVMMAFIPKLSGGRRPIGLLT